MEGVLRLARISGLLVFAAAVMPAAAVATWTEPAQVSPPGGYDAGAAELTYLPDGRSIVTWGNYTGMYPERVTAWTGRYPPGGAASLSRRGQRIWTGAAQMLAGATTPRGDAAIAWMGNGRTRGEAHAQGLRKHPSRWPSVQPAGTARRA